MNIYDSKNGKGIFNKTYVCIIIGLVILSIIGVLLFTNNTRSVKIDIDKLSDDIIQNIKFEDEMNEVDSETIKELYDIDNAISQKVYVSSGATAEEIAIFEFRDKNEVKTAIDKVNKRIEEQKLSFQNYMPKEIKKLEDTVIIKKGNYLIICITDDDFENIQKIINKNIK